MELPTEVLCVLFDKLSTPELSALRVTCKGMQKSVDDYIQHKCVIKITKNNLYCSVFKSIYDTVNKIMEKDSEKLAFVLNCVTINFGELYFSDYQDIKHVLRMLRFYICGDKKEPPAEKRAILKTYNETVFNIIVKLMDDKSIPGIFFRLEPLYDTVLDRLDELLLLSLRKKK